MTDSGKAGIFRKEKPARGGWGMGQWERTDEPERDVLNAAVRLFILKPRLVMTLGPTAHFPAMVDC